MPGGHADELVVRVAEERPCVVGFLAVDVVDVHGGSDVSVEVSVVDVAVIRSQKYLVGHEARDAGELLACRGIEQINEVRTRFDRLIVCDASVVHDDHVVHLEVGLVVLLVASVFEVPGGELEVAPGEIAERLDPGLAVGLASAALGFLLALAGHGYNTVTYPSSQVSQVSGTVWALSFSRMAESILVSSWVSDSTRSETDGSASARLRAVLAIM